MDLCDLRLDFEYRTQRRKQQATSTWNQHQIAGADFETKNGFPHILSWTVFDGNDWNDYHFHFGGTVEDPQMFLEANNGNEEQAFDLRLLCSLFFHTGNFSQGGFGKRKKPQEMFFFNLAYDAQAIIKTLHEEAIQTLLIGNEVIIDCETWNVASGVERKKIPNPNFGKSKKKGGKKDKRKTIQAWVLNEANDAWRLLPFNRFIKVSYLPKKHLCLEPLKFYTDGVKWGKVDCWDIRPFCGGGSLNMNAQKILNETKLDFTKEEMELMGSLSAAGVAFSQTNYDKIVEYAEKDSNLTARIAWNIVESFESNGVRMKRPYSPASVAERACLDRCNIPTMNDMMRIHHDSSVFAWSAYQGGWFESVGSGYSPNVRAYDITSAYPHVMWWLPDMEYGEWVGSPYGDSEKEAWQYLKNDWSPYSLSYFECEVVFPRGLNIYPASKKSEAAGCLMNPRIVYGFFTGDEIKEFQLWGADIGIERWTAFIPMNDVEEGEDVQDGIRYPFRPFIRTFYGGKLEQDQLKGTPEYDPEKRAIFKLMINSLYGKTVQAIEHEGMRRTGQLWNPFYASVITAGCRSRMAEMIRINGHENILAVNTDGLIFKDVEGLIVPENPKPVHFEGERINLGDWEEDGEGSLLLMMSGVYSILKEVVNEQVIEAKTTFRGAYSMFIDHRNDEGELTSNLYGEDWLSFCIRYADEEEVSRNAELNPTMRPYSLAEANIRNDFQLTNVFRIVELTIRAFGDSNKRKWRTRPTTFGDLVGGWFSSEPHEVLI